jgi:transcriptional regulator
VYVPPFNAFDDESAIRAFVAVARTGWLVTVGSDAVPLATLLPVLWHDDVVIMHMAKANPQWRAIEPGSPGLIIVSGAEAYVSPSWYASKREHGRVVPTWNYSAVHLTGAVTVHEDPEWLRSAVSALTDEHEAPRDEPWAVTDAPESYVEGQLRGIVGIALAVSRIEGKAKLSQNRSEVDRRGVVDGLRADADDRRLTDGAAAQALAVAAAMAHDVGEPTDGATPSASA